LGCPYLREGGTTALSTPFNRRGRKKFTQL
jgi:hypothetical protein